MKCLATLTVILFAFFVISRKYIQIFQRYTCLKLNSEKTDRLFFYDLFF